MKEEGSKHVKNAFLIEGNNMGKSMAGVAMAGIIVIAALLLSGLSLMGSYQQPAMAQQQNMTGGGGGNTTAATTTSNRNQSEIRFHIEEALTALQNNDTQGALMQLNLALNTLGGTGGAEGNVTTTGTTVAGTDNTGERSGGGSTDANRPETDTREEDDSECGGVTVGGTSAADDYGCPPDPDY